MWFPESTLGFPARWRRVFPPAAIAQVGCDRASQRGATSAPPTRRAPPAAVAGIAFRGNCLLACVALAALPARGEIKVGDTFPRLDPAALAPLAAGSLPETAGKVVLVDFWASWCAPCKASFPMMSKLHRELGARGFIIVAVGIDEKPAAAAAFVKKLAPEFPTVHDRSQQLVKQVVVPGMPTSYLIDRAGRVRFIHRGFHGERTERELRPQIESLLAEKN